MVRYGCRLRKWVVYLRVRARAEIWLANRCVWDGRGLIGKTRVVYQLAREVTALVALPLTTL